MPTRLPRSAPHRHGRISPAVAGAAGACVALFASIAFLAGAAFGPTRPAVVASVDLEKVYNSLDAQAAADAEVQALADSMKKEVDAKRADMDDMRAELESFQPDSAGYKKLLADIELAALRFNAEVEFNRQKLEARRAELMRRTYDRIKTGAAEYSKSKGIDIVFLDDSIPPLDPADAARTMQQISARRMIYCSGGLDITDELITFLNGRTTSGEQP